MLSCPLCSCPCSRQSVCRLSLPLSLLGVPPLLAHREAGYADAPGMGLRVLWMPSNRLPDSVLCLPALKRRTVAAGMIPDTEPPVLCIQVTYEVPGTATQRMHYQGPPPPLCGGSSPGDCTPAGMGVIEPPQVCSKEGGEAVSSRPTIYILPWHHILASTAGMPTSTCTIPLNQDYPATVHGLHAL